MKTSPKFQIIKADSVLGTFICGGLTKEQADSLVEELNKGNDLAPYFTEPE